MNMTHRTHRVIAAGMLIGVVLQFYFAGLAAFGATTFEPHAAVGYTLIVGAVILTIVAAIGRAGRGRLGRSALLVGLTMLQPVLAFAPRTDAPAISALHVVNALGILMLVVQLTRVPNATASPSSQSTDDIGVRKDEAMPPHPLERQPS